MPLCHPHGQSPRRPERQQTLIRITCTTGLAWLRTSSVSKRSARRSTWQQMQHQRRFLWVQARSRRGRWAGLSRRVGQSFAGPGEIKRKEVVLDPQQRPAEIKSWEVELAHKVGPPFASDVPQQLCYGHCPCDCSAQQLEQQLYTSCYANRGPRRLNIVVALAGPRPPRSFRVRARWRAIHCPPPPPSPVPNKPSRFRGRKSNMFTYLRHRVLFPVKEFQHKVIATDHKLRSFIHCCLSPSWSWQCGVR